MTSGFILTQCNSSDQIEKNEIGGAYSAFRERRSVYRVLVGKAAGKRPPGRTRCRWEENIKMDLQDVKWGAWTGLMWLRVGTGGGHLSMW
jgi:hypothetical protein